MKRMIIAAAAAGFLGLGLMAPAVAMPIGAQAVDAAGNVEQVRLVCDEYGRCFRTRGPRYVRPGYGYGGGYDRGYDRGPRYERRGYYGGGPSVSFGFGGGRGW
ncbi:hypothetical protein BH11PSE4_BH11PSE4_28770 [soil metagenome]